MPYFKPFPVPDESDLRRFGGGAQDCCPQMHQNPNYDIVYSGDIRDSLYGWDRCPLLFMMSSSVRK
jgi:hypothetical protein